MLEGIIAAFAIILGWVVLVERRLSRIEASIEYLRDKIDFLYERVNSTRKTSDIC
jgi:hypothetical protein